MRVDRDSRFDGDGIVLDRVKPEIRRPTPAFSAAISHPHCQVLMRLGAVSPQRLNSLANQEHPPRSIDESHIAVRFPHGDAVAALDGSELDHCLESRKRTRVNRPLPRLSQSHELPKRSLNGPM